VFEGVDGWVWVSVLVVCVDVVAIAGVVGGTGAG
jgi:hypothetical protein